MQQPLLRLDSIEKSFGGVRALRGVNFELLAGEVHALVGENGAGKSTMVKIITGAQTPDSGSITLSGKTIGNNSPGLAKSLGIAAIYQQPALFADLTVAENIALRVQPPTGIGFINWRRRRNFASDLLSRIGARIDPSKRVNQLRLPEQQLVEIACALGNKPKLLILDEPTASLSDAEVQRLFAIIRDLRQQSVGMIYISHRLEELAGIADRVTVLRDGNQVCTHLMADVDRTKLIRLMVGRDVETVYPTGKADAGEVVLETRSLTSRSNGVRNVNLSLRRGEILGLGGLMGSGRSELARTLFGIDPASGGQIRVNGRIVQINSPINAISQGIAYLPEDRIKHGVVPEMSVAVNTTLAILRSISRGTLIDFKRERSVAEMFVKQLGTKTQSIETAVGQLSGGNQQKVAIARWLASKPVIMILDEPTQGVDVGAKAEIHALIRRLTLDGIAVLLISSELPELLGMSDRIAVMNTGQVAGILERGDATQERILDMAFTNTSSGAPE